MKNLHSTAPESTTKTTIAVILATFLATIIAGMATVALLYVLFLQFQS